ncbi:MULTISPECIES: MOP flippase family protein [Bacteria]|uniref:MOP flippase family protein n=1 Tax=Bacteria TaxID=2 RepID=UPI003C7C43DA
MWGSGNRRGSEAGEPTINHLQRATSATKWTTLSVVILALSQLLIVLVLARILDKHDMGLVAIVTMIYSLMDVFVGMGLTSALIQRRRVTSYELSSVHWANVTIGVLFLALTIVLSPVFAGWLGAPDSQNLIIICAVAFLVTALGQASRAMLEKRLIFRPLGIADAIFGITSFVVAIVLALLGAGAYSAAIGLVVAALGRTITFVVAGRRVTPIRLRFRLRDTRRFFSFGVWQSIDGILNYTGNTLSALATGRLVSTAALGGYNLAFNVGVSIPGRVNPIVTRILFPYFSIIQDDLSRIRRNYLQMVTLLGLVSIPLLVGVAIVPADVMAVVFGAEWSEFGTILAILAIAGMFRALGNPLGSLLMATNRMRLGVYINMVRTAFNIPLVILMTMAWGVTGAAWAMVVMGVMSYFIGFGCLRVVTGVDMRSYLAATLPPFLLSIPMAVVVAGLSLLMAGQPSLIRLLVLIPVALLVLAGTLLLSRDPAVQLFVTEIRRRLTRAGSPALAVMMPVDERFDGTGGAAASWARNAYSQGAMADVDYAIYCPLNRGSFSSGIRRGPIGLYEPLDRVLRACARAAASVTGRNANSIRRILTGKGKHWVWFLYPRLAGSRVVHIHNRPSYAAYLRRLGYSGRIVVHMHNDAVDSIGAALSRDRSMSAEEITEAVDLWFFCSEFLSTRAAAEFSIADRSGVLHNGPTVTDAVPGQHGVHSPLRLAFAGRIIPDKGVLEAVRVAEEVGRTHPVVLDIYGGRAIGAGAGDSPYMRQVRELAEQISAEDAGATIRMHGFVPAGELSTRLAEADLFLYPCRWDEPFGMVIVDAMAVGTPAVTVRRGGITEIVTDGKDGRLLDPGASAAEIAAVVVELSETSDYGAMRESAGDTVRDRFSWGRIAGEMIEAIEATGENVRKRR